MNKINEIIKKVFLKIKTITHKFLNYKVYKNDVVLYGIPTLIHRENIYIGDKTRINPEVVLYGHGGINIGKNVTLSHGVSIYSTGYDTSNWEKSKFIKKHFHKAVTIQDNSWIGANTIILKGVTIAEGCIVAAGSVVTKSLTVPNALYAGNPVKFVKKL